MKHFLYGKLIHFIFVLFFPFLLFRRLASLPLSWDCSCSDVTFFFSFRHILIPHGWLRVWDVKRWKKKFSVSFLSSFWLSFSWFPYLLFFMLVQSGFCFGQEDFISIVRSTSWYEELRSDFYFPSFSLFVHQFENNTLFLLHILLLIFILTFFSSKMKIMSKFRILTYYWMISKSERPSKSHRSTPCHSSFEKHFCDHISTWLFFI